MKFDFELSSKEEFIFQKFWLNVDKNKNYNSLNKLESDIIRDLYRRQFDIDFPNFDQLVGKSEIINGYHRIVFGNHGPYVEFSDCHLKCTLEIKAGQGFRVKSDRVKYIWYNPIGNEDVKIYFQKGLVRYADYKIGYYYIAPEQI